MEDDGGMERISLILPKLTDLYRITPIGVPEGQDCRQDTRDIPWALGRYLVSRGIPSQPR